MGVSRPAYPLIGRWATGSNERLSAATSFFGLAIRAVMGADREDADAPAGVVDLEDGAPVVERIEGEGGGACACEVVTLFGKLERVVFERVDEGVEFGIKRGAVDAVALAMR